MAQPQMWHRYVISSSFFVSVDLEPHLIGVAIPLALLLDFDGKERKSYNAPLVPTEIVFNTCNLPDAPYATRVQHTRSPLILLLRRLD